MRATVIVLLAVLATAGCASSGTGSTDQTWTFGQPRILCANEASITLTNIFFSNDANNLRIADEHCKQYDKVAQFVSREKDRRRYNCVKP